MSTGKKKVEDPVEVVPRSQWADDVNMKYAPRLKFPLSHVRFAQTGTAACRNKQTCIDILQLYQDDKLAERHEDVTYNFFIGGDGVVYEGRGWEYEAERPPRWKFKLRGKCVDIAYIGDFQTEPLPPLMIQTSEKFLKKAIKEKKLQNMPNVVGFQEFIEDDNDFLFEELY